MSSSRKNLKFAAVIGIASFLIVLLLVFYGDIENPKKLSLARLETIEQALTDYVRANHRAPANLAELGLPQETLQDHIGEPFKYLVEGDKITVLSYGADKEPGGSFFKKDYSIEVDLR